MYDAVFVLHTSRGVMHVVTVGVAAVCCTVALCMLQYVLQHVCCSVCVAHLSWCDVYRHGRCRGRVNLIEP